MKKRLVASLLLASSLLVHTPVYASNSNVSNSTNKSTTAVSNTNKAEDVDKYLKDGKFTVLLLGIDGPTNEGQRSDTIMIAQFNKKAKEIRIISMPRDSNLDIPGHGFEKATHAFAYGGAELSSEMISNNLDMKLDGYMTLNFTSFPQFIDTIGGVTLELSEGEAGIAVGKAEANTYKLKGSQALTFGRIRKIDSDYMRTGRHRRLMKAILETIKSKDISEIPALANSLNELVNTNVDSKALLALGKYAYENDFKIVDTLIPDEENSWGDTIDGAWVLMFDIPEAKAKMKEFFK